ncbi:MAG: hypothetical protein SynsKO_18050 [Synoicihabitans sp.]
MDRANSPPILARAVRGFVHALVRFYYPRIEVSGEGAIPDEGPVLLVANHPNSLLDPVLLGIASRRPVRLLAKAPLFNIRGLGALMRAFGMIPAHRGSDSRSREEIKKNLASLAQAATALGDDGGSVVGIFPEGKSHDDLQVGLVRSGAARLAMQAVAAGVKGLRIVPVGLNYESKDRFRSAVWINVGEAIDADAWLAEHGDERAAMRALTPEIDQRMKQVAIHLEDAAWVSLLQEVEGLLPAKRGLKAVGLLKLRRRVADAINHFHRTEPERSVGTVSRLETWATLRRESGLPSDARFFRQPLWLRLLSLGMDVLKLGAVLMLAVPGFFHHTIPHVVARWWAARMDQPGKMTVALNRLMAGLVVHGVWAGLVWAAMMRVFQPWVAWTWLAAIPFTGLAAIWLVRRLRLVVPIWWAEVWLLPQRKKVRQLRETRARVVAELTELAREFPGGGEPLPCRRLLRAPWWMWVTVSTLVGLVAFTIGAWMMRDRPVEIWRTAGPALHHMAIDDLARRMTEDERELMAVINGLEDLESRFRKFEIDLNAGERSYYRPEDDDEMRRMFVTYLSLRSALIRMAWHYERFDQVRESSPRLRAQLLHYTAAALLYDYSARFVLAFEDSEQAQRKLNEGEPRWGLDAGIYDRIRTNLANLSHRQWLVREWDFYRNNLSLWSEVGLGPDDPNPYAKFHAVIGDAGARTAELGERILPYKVATAWSELRRVFGGGYYRASAAISTLVGDAKIRAPRDGRSLITPELVEELRPMLQPGDVLIERRNWYLSNAFLPGYWPHAALYVGSPQDLVDLGLGNDPGVAAWEALGSPVDEAGYAMRVIEAVSEGVIFTSLEHSVGEADAVVVLRPRVTQAQRRSAIARAFSHAGKPYDFDFDFFSSDRLVCTELVYRAYGDMVELPLVEIMGRKTLPAINIVEAWAKGEDWDFVAMLDGDEDTGRCEWGDETTLRESLDRPPLTWLN